MEEKPLGKDIIALVQHVELNESGWIDVAVVKAVKFLLWLISAPTTVEQIYYQRGTAGFDAISREQIQSAIDHLLKAESAVPLPGNFIKLSEVEASNVERAVSQAGEIETGVKARVLEAATTAGADCSGERGNRLWDRFHSEFVAPFIREFGARAYELIVGVSTDAQRTQFISEFLTKFPEEQRSVLEPMILALLDRNNLGCRTYVLRLLNSYFFHSALSLPNEIIARAFSKPDRQRNLRLVLDTNFLFSLFELHTNPSNEAVALLLKTITKLPPGFQIKMYVLPATIEEFRRSLVAYETQARSISTSSGIVAAALKVDLSGVLQTYLRNLQKSEYKISAKEYFEPYHTNIKALLEQHKVSILNGEDEKYSTDQGTINDITDQLSFYQRRFINEPRRQKSYEQVRHDMVLWHFISDRRPQICDTVFDAEWIGVTIDFGLMAFDAHKRRAHGIPCMAHPASLVQVLQMLIPVDENLERTILALMQMPFMFEPFNLDDEKITRQILGTLSRFEGAGNLTSDTIIGILGNKVLRGKFERSQSKEEEVELIKDAIIAHAAELEQKIQTSQLELKSSREEQERQRQLEKEKFEKITEEQKRNQIELEEERARVSAAAEEQLRLREELNNLKAMAGERDIVDLRRSEWARLRFASICLILVFSACFYLIWEYWLPLRTAGGGLAPWALLASAIAILSQLYWRYVQSLTAISESLYYWLLGKAVKLTWGLYVFVAIAIIQPLIYDLGKDEIPLLQHDNNSSMAGRAK